MAKQVVTRERVLPGPGSLGQVLPKNELHVLYGSQRIGEFGAVWSKDQAVVLSLRYCKVEGWYPSNLVKMLFDASPYRMQT